MDACNKESAVSKFVILNFIGFSEASTCGLSLTVPLEFFFWPVVKIEKINAVTEN